MIYLAKTKEFIKKYNTGNLINVLDLHFRYDFNKNFDIYSTPTVFVLDENKAILGKRIPLEDIMGFITFYKKKQEALKNKK